MEHFHADVVVTVTCLDPQTLANVHESVSRVVTGLAMEHGVEPEISIYWPHNHFEHDDEDEDETVEP